MVGNTRLAKVVMVLELVCIVMAALGITSASQYKVGDADGWIIGKVNYTTWVASKKFYAGDSLLFEYNKEWHNVLQVTKSGYDSCKNGSAIATYESGNDTVNLPNTGLYYYLCGIQGHCEVGQKVAINVLAAKGTAPSLSPSPSPSPAASKKSKSAASSPSPSVISKSSPSPKSAKNDSTLAPASKNNALAKSVGYTFMALMWALGALLLCL